MTDEQYPRSADDDADPQARADVERLLADLTYLRPDESDISDEPMPDWAWTRISSALHDEAAAMSPASRSSRSRLVRWGGGLVAASVAVLAVGLAVNVSSGSGDGGAVVADAAPSTEAQTLSLQGADTDEQAGAEAAPERAAEAEPFAQQRQINFAGMVPPALSLTGSRTNYSKKDMQGQVTEALEEHGLAPISAMPSPEPTIVEVEGDVPEEGFLASPRALRDCITKLTTSPKSTALLIDTSMYEGRQASIVVAPDYDVPAAQAPDLSMIEVWVVDPDCQVTWQMRFRLGR